MTSVDHASLDSARTAAIDRLVAGYGHGHISRDELERRLDRAFEAPSAADLEALTADLPAVAASELPAGRPELLVAEESPEADDVEHMIHVFGGGNRSGAWTVPSEIRMVNIFGGGDVDFTEARFSSPVTRLKVFCLFGGANIYVHEGINTTCKAVAIFGGFENRAPSNMPGGPRLIIEGFALFGGASIKVKRSLKDRLVEFAEAVRQAFRPAL